MFTPITGLKNWFLDGVGVRCPGVVLWFVIETAGAALLGSVCGVEGACAAALPASESRTQRARFMIDIAPSLTTS